MAIQRDIVEAALVDITTKTVELHASEGINARGFVLTGKCKNCKTLAQARIGDLHEPAAWRNLSKHIKALRIGQENCLCRVAFASLRAKVKVAMKDVTEQTARQAVDQGRRFTEMFTIDGICKNCDTPATSYAEPGYELQAWASLVALIRTGRIGRKDCECKANLAEAAA